MTFDPAAFMDAQVDAPMATDFELCPEGEYQFMIDDFDASIFQTQEFTYKKGPNAGQPGVMNKANIPFVCLDENVKQALKRDKVVVRTQIVFDLDEAGRISTEKDKNVTLGRLRAALGQNEGPWSFQNLRGAGPLLGKVTHRNIAKEGEEPRYIAEVSRFGRIT